jgi:gamma-glutamylaminecyclotransferase
MGSSVRHLVFVYGTLKTGEPNHSVMSDAETGRAEFVGIGTTINKYPLVIGSRYNIPFLLAQDGTGNASLAIISISL